MSALSEQFAKPGTSSADPGPDRADRDRERSGDLGVGQPLDREQDHRVAVTLREPTNRSPDARHHGLGVDPLAGPFEGVDAQWDASCSCSALQRSQTSLLAPALSVQHVRGNPVQPRASALALRVERIAALVRDRKTSPARSSARSGPTRRARYRWIVTEYRSNRRAKQPGSVSESAISAASVISAASSRTPSCCPNTSERFAAHLLRSKSRYLEVPVNGATVASAAARWMDSGQPQNDNPEVFRWRRECAADRAPNRRVGHRGVSAPERGAGRVTIPVDLVGPRERSAPPRPDYLIATASTS